ncbi:MAG: hypothetical protein IJ370_02960 [Oscillospiraceae bacterium]|nr:hypothetical protein [Oscillospiraceae bacterium]
MDNKFSVDDILKELENKNTQKPANDDEYAKIMEEVLGKKIDVKPSVLKTISSLTEEKKEEPKKEAEKEEVKVEAAEKKPEVKEVKPEPKEKKPQISFKSAEGDTIAFDKPIIEKPQDKKPEFKVKIEYEDNIPEAPEPKKETKFEFEEQTIQMEPFGLGEEVEIKPEENIEVNKDLIEFRENRKKKVEKFVLFGEEEEDTEPDVKYEEQPEQVKVLEDFNDYSESTAVIKDLSGIKAGLTLRLIVLFALSLVSAYIELGNRYSLPMLEIFDKDIQPLSYLIVSALVFIAAVIVSAPAVLGGLSSLFKFKADGDSLLAVSALGCTLQYAVLFVTPSYISTAKNTICIYGLVAILAMLVNAIGKLLIIRRVRLNFRFVSGGYEKYAVTMPESEKLSTFVKEQFDAPYASVAVPKRTDFIGNFLSYSYKEDVSDKMSRFVAPILTLGALLLAVGSFVIVRDFHKAVCTFAAVTSICAPVSVMLSVNLPMLRATKSLVSKGSMISSLEACNEIYDTNSILVKSSDLFPKGSIQLSAIKTFAAGKIDDVILDAASVVIRAESDLSDVFLSVIGGRKDLLRPVDSIVYEESMGLSAWVESKRVLIGNRELISNHGIDVPSKDYEERYLNSGMDMVYLAESGELAAVFLIQYKPGKQIKKAMKALKNLGIGVVAVSTDPNINSKKIARIFEVDESMIKTVPADKQGETEFLMRPSSRENVGTASISSFTAFVQTVYAAIKLKGIASLAVTLQTVGVILAFALMAFFTFMSGSISISIEAILLYQLFWLAAVTVIPAFKSFKI